MVAVFYFPLRSQLKVMTSHDEALHTHATSQTANSWHYIWLALVNAFITSCKMMYCIHKHTFHLRTASSIVPSFSDYDMLKPQHYTQSLKVSMSWSNDTGKSGRSQMKCVCWIKNNTFAWLKLWPEHMKVSCHTYNLVQSSMHAERAPQKMWCCHTHELQDTNITYQS